MIKLLNRTELNTALPLIYRPELCKIIVKELRSIDFSRYKDSMTPLIQKDIKELQKVLQ